MKAENKTFKVRKRNDESAYKGFWKKVALQQKDDEIDGAGVEKPGNESLMDTSTRDLLHSEQPMQVQSPRQLRSNHVPETFEWVQARPIEWKPISSSSTNVENGQK